MPSNNLKDKNESNNQHFCRLSYAKERTPSVARHKKDESNKLQHLC